MKSHALLVLLALLALPAAALEPYLVKDINPVPSPADSNPSELVTLGGAVLFFADDGVSGLTLWRSDGTPEGTWLVSDVCQDGCPERPRSFMATERLYFFLAGSSLWVTDGTPGGTLRLTDPGLGLSSQSLWVASQGLFYFAAEDQEHGYELWRSDGTPAGTWLLSDIRPGPQGSPLGGLAEYKGRLWFAADDGQRGGALWSSDGTPAGTVLAFDPLPASASHPPPQTLWVVGSRLAFFAPTPGRGEQLWAGDGTAKGTAPVTTLSRGKTPSVLLDAVVRGNRLYFVAQDRKGQELWISDGTGRGTRVLTNFPNPAAFFQRSSIVWHLELPRQQPAGSRFVFQAHDGPHGIETWTTDGTPKGTRLLRDFCPGDCSGSFNLGTSQGRLFLVVYGGDRSGKLWSTDGTVAGTRLVAELCPGPCFLYFAGSYNLGTRLVFLTGNGQLVGKIWSTDGTAAGTTVQALGPDQFYGGPPTVLNGKLLFALRDGLHGTELWSTDGTAAGPQLVKDVNRTDPGGSFPRGLRALGDEAVFGASDGAPGLWKSDGTEAGTVRFKTFDPGEVIDAMPVGASAESGGRLFFFLQKESFQSELWRTDGTEAGTILLTGEGVRSWEEEVRAVGGTVYFAATEENGGSELWASDGTPGGTRRVRDIAPGPGGSEPRELTAFQGKLYFTTRTSGGGLWRSDGTEAGTVPVVELSPKLLTVHAGRLWFFAPDDEHGWELWSSDGTAAGTHLAVDFAPGPESFFYPFLVSLGDRLVVSFQEDETWVTDGTQAGTRKIHDQGIYEFHGWTVFQGRLYYTLRPEGAFREPLRVTDGTETGTGLLLDRDGQEIYDPFRFVHLDDRLVFTVADFGIPLWESDGTPSGTFRLLPETSRGNNPRELVRAGARVFFPAYDRATGWELWAVEP
jgi:ELWxxDGT repeat protein